MNMSVIAVEAPDRRRQTRQPAGFPFWYRRTRRFPSVAAWMVNFSAGGASFIAPADEAPVTGEKLRLASMPSGDSLVRSNTPELPRFARVLRIAERDGENCTVAVRFLRPGQVP